jgi:23S rRNA pseudouridine1911/1915/1917 synthase
LKKQSKITATEAMIGLRLDKALGLLPEIKSRSRSETLIKNGHVTVNSKPAKSSLIIQSDDVIEYQLPEKTASDLTPYNFKLEIIFEDSDLAVINKPPGLVVHPAAGHEHDTLVNALIHHTKDLSMKFGEDRPGIVHRLDKETSGLLVIAKNDSTHESLSQQFKDRSVHRIYQAICLGIPPIPNGRIVSYLARNPNHRKKFASVRDTGNKIIRDPDQPPQIGKLAITNYWTEKTHSSGASLIKLKLETGRTHQIRVHLSEMGHPILADATYGALLKIKNLNGNLAQQAAKEAPRCALHAAELGFVHPQTKKNLFFKVPWPDLETVREFFFPGAEL